MTKWEERTREFELALKGLEEQNRRLDADLKRFGSQWSDAARLAVELDKRVGVVETELKQVRIESSRIRELETRLSVLESRLAKLEPLLPQFPDIDKRLAVAQKALDLLEKAADPVRVGNLQSDVAELKNVAAQNRLTWPMLVGWGVPVLLSLVSLFVSLLRTQSPT